MRKAVIIINFLCVIFIILIFNNYRIDNYISDDINKALSDKKYEIPIELKNFSIYGQLYNYSCGPTTLSMVYTYMVKPMTEKQLTEELNLGGRKKGMLPNTFLKYLKLNLSSYKISLKSNIPDSEVLRLIYGQLEKGVPVPVYFSTINDWDRPNYDTHYSIVTGIDVGRDKVIIANAYGYREEVNIKDFLDSLKYKNYKNKPFYLIVSTFIGIIKKNNIYLIYDK